MKYDVLIIGGRLAGLRVALEAEKEGFSVAVLSMVSHQIAFREELKLNG